MVAKRDRKMGRFNVEIELVNYSDMIIAERGIIPADKVRRKKMLGLVDCGASNLVLPTHVAKELGLDVTGKVKVTYADRSAARRDKAEAVYLELMGRHGLFSATLEPKRDVALIGAIVLEELDFLVDSKLGKLYPRDPKYVVNEIG